MDNSDKDTIKQLRKFEVTCPNCKKSSPLRKWGFVQTHWYQSPYGPCHMLGGDYEEHEDIHQCLLICPRSCLPNGNNLAKRIMDLQIPRLEREQVFGTIKMVTDLLESKLNRIFDGHYVQYGEGKEIKSSEEIREEKKAENEIDF